MPSLIIQQIVTLLSLSQNTGHGYAERLVGPEAQWAEPGANGAARRRRPQDIFNANGKVIATRCLPVRTTRILCPAGAQPAAQEPTEENITFLTSMGFPRDRVVRALQSTGNNLEVATNLLLQEA